MRAISVMVLAAALATAPLAVQAQTTPTAPLQAQPAPIPAPVAPGTVRVVPGNERTDVKLPPVTQPGATIFGLTPTQALAVGVGVVVGGVGVGLISHGPLATVVGGVGGAMIGNWWYATQPESAAVPPPQLR